jgi:arylsulfatase A-like enzyme
MHRPNRDRIGLLALALFTAGCAPGSDSGARSATVVRLAESFDADRVEGGGELFVPEPIRLRFDGPLPEPKEKEEPKEEGDETSSDEEETDPEPDFSATYGFEPLLDIEGLVVADGLLTGKTGEIPVLHAEIEELDDDDVLHSIQVRLRVSKGGTLSLGLSTREKFEREKAVQSYRRKGSWLSTAEVKPSEEPKLITVTRGHMKSERLSEIRHLFLQPTDAEGASFAIEEIRFISRGEHLAGVPSGISSQGLGSIYRQTLVLRAPERTRLPLSVHEGAWIDLAIGTIDGHPVTFRVAAHVTATGEEVHLMRRTVTTPDRWEEVPLDLEDFAGRDIELVLSVNSPNVGAIGFFGTPVVRTRRADPPIAGAPRGVIVILADTLRRDHLKAYGYERETAPTVTRLASEGAVFLDNISQGTWTKVSVPSMLTSTYPTSNGIVNETDRLPDSVTTLAESFQNAGYATFATSSVPFTGKLSNLHQGLDVVHERSSLAKTNHSRSKTGRAFVDQMLEWIEAREGGPFYARLHVFDPHSPFMPYDPYADVWSEPGAEDAHEEAVEKLTEWQKENDEEEDDMPRREQLDAAEVSTEEFIQRQIDWYDESIRAMDVELARLFERLEELGLADEVLVVFVSDHGEEFLEHDNHFHGKHTYGEMTNVPLILWGPRWVPPGTVVEETVQTLDMMPTVLELTGLLMPKEVQGQSLVPLINGESGWQQLPAISERHRPTWEREPKPDDTESYSIVHEGYRLVHQFTRPEGWPEYELFDHVDDPLNLNDIAAEHPQIVKDMKQKLELWKRWAEAHPLEGAGEGVELTAEEQAELAALGYGG